MVSSVSYELILKRYVIGSFAYGFIRKVDEMSDARLYTRDYDSKANMHYDKPYPMLITDKVAVLAISTAASPWLLPMYIYNDLNALEIRIRCLNPMLYGYNHIKRSWISYLF
jgi:hypothetical protein